jgi:predicted site-specific integrase-resolvase
LEVRRHSSKTIKSDLNRLIQLWNIYLFRDITQVDAVFNSCNSGMCKVSNTTLQVKGYIIYYHWSAKKLIYLMIYCLVWNILVMIMDTEIKVIIATHHDRTLSKNTNLNVRVCFYSNMSQFVVTIAELYIFLHKLEPGHRLFLSFVRIVVCIDKPLWTFIF